MKAYSLVPLATVLLCWCSPVPGAAQGNLVRNGDFESGKGDLLEYWQVAGSADVQQQLSTDSGRSGGRSAKLVCMRMGNDSPSAHAMICQVGQVAVRRGQWYRLRFWARARDLREGACSVALTNTKLWKSVGLDEAFLVGPEWQQQEFVFRASDDLPAGSSRLQFWFKSTGTLWLDDVELAETSDVRQWQPQWTTEGLRNFLPNSSFECGTANWGSYSAEPGGWGNHLFELLGQIDPAGGRHGNQCLRIVLTPETAPVFSFDYFDAIRRPVRRALAANLGWLRVTAGQRLTLSAYLRADQQGATARLAAIQADGPVLSTTVNVGTTWQRYEFSFKPDRLFLFVAVGPDLDAGKLSSVTMWVDAVQLEQGSSASEFVPRQPVESFLLTPERRTVFTEVQQGIPVSLVAYNDSDGPVSVRGLVLYSLNGGQAQRSFPVELALRPRSAGSAGFRWGDKYGFYQVSWNGPGAGSGLRCALIRPHQGGQSPIGMNHAYPWDFLVRLAHLAGINQWRDWSAKWHVVEPQPGRFDFSASDAQIGRVIALGGQPVVLLPFPSAGWSSTYRAEADPSPPDNDYERRRKPLAYAPKDLADFGRYAAAVARQYKGRARWYQILNEPIYTSYALPRAYGYRLEDYLALVQVAYEAVKAADPDALVVGGIGAGPESALTRQFVEKGGIRFVDVLDLHIYRPPVAAESLEPGFAELEGLMQRHGGSKPVWITEYGCYADDDPACLPHWVGDASMNRCRFPTEQSAAEHIVKFVAVSFAHGVRKIFFHAGVGGRINGEDAGGVFFEYGGAPRKMYPAVAALTRILGVPDTCLFSVKRQDLSAFVFRCGQRTVGIAWAGALPGARLRVASGVTAYDMMGNDMYRPEVDLTSSPVYLVEADGQAGQIRQMLGVQRR